MRVHTLQLPKWRVASKLGIETLDTTVKSGNRIYAPTWGLLDAYKKSLINKETYTVEFYKLMRESFIQNRTEWLDLMHKEEIALMCYCKPGEFCHRLLLVDILSKQCSHFKIPFTYIGELT